MRRGSSCGTTLTAAYSMGVDLFIVGVGVECDLTLIDASLPLNLDLATTYNPTDASSKATAPNTENKRDAVRMIHTSKLLSR